jgi:LysM repeat protein
LWLALQPYANARLCLFEVDRPESRSPVPIRRHVIDCFLEQSGIVSGYNDTALTDPGDVLLRGYLCRAAILPVSTSNTFDWLAAEQAWATPGFRDEAPLPWDPTLLGTVQAPCQGVMWLGDLALLQPEGGLPSGGRAQFAGCQVMHFGADYGPGGIGLLVQPLLGEAIQLVLRPHSVLVLRDGDTLNLIAERYGTTESKLRSLNPVLEQSQPYVTREGETLSSVAAEQNLSLSLLRQFNAELSSWPSTEPLAAGTTLLLPVYRSTPPPG